AALWLDVFNRRSDRASGLAQAVDRFDMTEWPAPLIRLLLGQMALEAAIASAGDPDPKEQQEQVCQANFYAGELALIQGTKEKAASLFRLVATDCPASLIEWAAAHAELRALGVVMPPRSSSPAKAGDPVNTDGSDKN